MTAQNPLPRLRETSTIGGRQAKPRPSRAPHGSAVTNGRRLHVVRPGDTAWARRFKTIYASFVSDSGGEANMTEARAQLCRRAATLCVEAEKLEIRSAGGPPPLEEAIKSAGGLKPIEIIGEAARVLHAIARIKGGDNLRQIADSPDLDRVIGLLKDAAGIANMAASYGEVDLELYGMVCDRLNRVLRTLGLERIPRDVNGGPSLGELMRQDADERRQAGAVIDGDGDG